MGGWGKRGASLFKEGVGGAKGSASSFTEGVGGAKLV